MSQVHHPTHMRVGAAGITCRTGWYGDLGSVANLAAHFHDMLRSGRVRLERAMLRVGTAQSSSGIISRASAVMGDLCDCPQNL